MPNAKTHALIGLGASGLVGFVAADGLPDEARVTVTLGSLCGGLVGALAPDVLEPAIHPWHRSVFHSAAFGTAVGKVGVHPIRKVVTDFRAEAATFRQQRLAVGTNHPHYGRLWFEEFGRYFLMGFLVGAPVGYLSHLLADMGTSRSIPLIGR